MLKNWKYFLFFVLAIAITKNLNAQTKNSSYKIGEKLEYSLNYGFINGGKGVLEVKKGIIDGKVLNHVICTGETVGVADALFKVIDQYESYINPETNLPIKSIRDIKEGKYRYYDEVTYDHDSLLAKSKIKGTVPVPSRIQDILSAFYYARNVYFNDNLKKGEVIQIMTYFSNELWPLRIRYNGIETIKTEVGKVECYRFTPITEVGRAFENEDDMEIWISRDSNRIPVKIKFKLFVGSFTCDLEKYSNLMYPFNSLKK
ncbi:MAG: DUF3108 domain-containing protein [Marinilabiliaceae bacterium]|nr:DUF3108 domain-containing protein [Marinilabiliaceae bacterium]